MSSNCRKKYPVRINSFFSKYPQTSLKAVSEVIKCFLIKKYNAEKCLSYLNNEANYHISKKTILDIYNDIREILYKYLQIIYQDEKLGIKDANEFFSIDESLICHKDGKQLWLLGAVNNNTKSFRIEATFSRDTETIKKFINKFIEKGNTIITDHLMSYNYLDAAISWYNHIKHNHGAGSFGFGIQSTSNIESIWSQINSKIKATYNTIPNKNILHFVREAEYKILLKKCADNDSKIKDFF